MADPLHAGTAMLDPALLRNHATDLAQRLAARGFVLDVAALESLEAERKAIQARTQELQNLRNTRSRAIGQAKAKGEDVAALMAEVAGFGDELKASEARLEQVLGQIEAIAQVIPNLPAEDVPVGADESANVEVRRWSPHGDGPRAFDFAVRDHVDLGQPLGLDFETGAKLAGARLSFMGLPCPNIFAGGHNYHGRFEYIPISSMEKAVATVLKIIELNCK